MKAAEGPKRSGRTTRSAATVSEDQVYVEIPLDPATLHAVEGLAQAAGRTPFEMCVTLLQERVCAAERI